jgi:hypothetical protein
MDFLVFFKSRTHKCTDGRAITVFRNPNDAVPLYVKPVTSQAKASFDTAATAKADVEAQYTQSVTGIASLVTVATENFLAKFRTIYQYYSEEPCSRDAYFRDKLDELLREQRRFEYVQLQLTTLIELSHNGSDRTGIMRILSRIHNSLTSPIEHTEITRQITKAPTLTEDWNSE